MNGHERRRARMREAVARCDLVLWDIAQEGLFEMPDDELVFIAVCMRCGRPLTRVPVEGGRDGHPWYAASLWCYLSQVEHNKQGCSKPFEPPPTSTGAATG
jgi:hypothetical protein